MSPIIQHHWHGIVFRLQKLGEFLFVVRGKTFERSRTRRAGVDDQGAADGVVVVGAEVGMIPVEAELVCSGEAVCEV